MHEGGRIAVDEVATILVLVRRGECATGQHRQEVVKAVASLEEHVPVAVKHLATDVKHTDTLLLGRDFLCPPSRLVELVFVPLQGARVFFDCIRDPCQLCHQ